MNVKIKLLSSKLFGKRGKKIEIELDSSFLIGDKYYKKVRDGVIEEKIKSLVMKEICGNWEEVL